MKIMHYFTSLLKKINPRKSPRAKRTYFEVAAAIAVVIAVGALSQLISPYQPIREAPFYDQSGQLQITHHRATVDSVEADGDEKHISSTVIDGPEKGSQAVFSVSIQENIEPNDTVILSKNQSTGNFTFSGYHRIPLMVVLLSVFIVVVLLVGRQRGASSIVGLVISIGIIGFGIIPLINKGYDALWVCIVGAFLIAIFSVLAAHGFRRRTYISLGCILFILVFVAIGANLAVHALQLSGFYDETVGFMLMNSQHDINLSGLLVGGIAIASLGVLDDIVTTQVATVEELLDANRELSLGKVYSKAWSVGAEHIAALVNTLALVYAGAALPLIIFLSSDTVDLYIFLNGEYLMTEIVRTLIASTALVVAVPISTFLASFMMHQRSRQKQAV